MKQNHISKWLKGLVFLLAVMGVVFFGGVTIVAFRLRMDYPGSLVWSFVFFSWYTAVLCYMVLFQFWKVCGEIENDNSFSRENAIAFHKMGQLGLASCAGYFVRMICLTVIGSIRIPIVCYSIFLMLLSVVFFILCESLSRLIQNAYEVKMENELTI